jgi:hypothetical protein
MQQEDQFTITAKGRAYIDAATRPRGGCASWVRAAWPAPRRSAETLSPAA